MSLLQTPNYLLLEASHLRLKRRMPLSRDICGKKVIADLFILLQKMARRVRRSSAILALGLAGGVRAEAPLALPRRASIRRIEIHFQTGEAAVNITKERRHCALQALPRPGIGIASHSQ